MTIEGENAKETARKQRRFLASDAVLNGENERSASFWDGRPFVRRLFGEFVFVVVIVGWSVFFVLAVDGFVVLLRFVFLFFILVFILVVFFFDVRIFFFFRRRLLISDLRTA